MAPRFHETKEIDEIDQTDETHETHETTSWLITGGCGFMGTSLKQLDWKCVDTF